MWFGPSLPRDLACGSSRVECRVVPGHAPSPGAAGAEGVRGAKGPGALRCPHPTLQQSRRQPPLRHRVNAARRRHRDVDVNVCACDKGVSTYSTTKKTVSSIEKDGGYEFLGGSNVVDPHLPHAHVHAWRRRDDQVRQHCDDHISLNCDLVTDVVTNEMVSFCDVTDFTAVTVTASPTRWGAAVTELAGVQVTSRGGAGRGASTHQSRPTQPRIASSWQRRTGLKARL